MKIGHSKYRIHRFRYEENMISKRYAGKMRITFYGHETISHNSKGKNFNGKMK